jgi:putative phage-type endonuclease
MGLSPEQVLDRVNYIGGTDAAAVLGLSRYKTPLGLWAEKTGTVPTKDRSGELPIKIGNRLEDVVAELFVDETGLKVQRVREIQVHPEYPFIRCQIDRRVLNTDNEPLECKTASAFKQGEWEGDDVPSEYIIQVMHQLMVLGAIAKKKGLPPPPRAHLACLIGGNVSFVTKIIERDEDMIAELEAKEVAFWNEHIQARKMPGVTEHDDGVLQALFPNGKVDQEEALQLSPEFEDIIERIKEIGTDKEGELGKLKAELDELKNEVKMAMGENSRAVVGRYEATWKNIQKKPTLDTVRLLTDKPELIVKYGKIPEPFRMLLTKDTTAKAAKKAKEAK